MQKRDCIILRRKSIYVCACIEDPWFLVDFAIFGKFAVCSYNFYTTLSEFRHPKEEGVVTSQLFLLMFIKNNKIIVNIYTSYLIIFVSLWVPHFTSQCVMSCCLNSTNWSRVKSSCNRKHILHSRIGWCCRRRGSDRGSGWGVEMWWCW